ncbi:AraC family transcriptional regulator [Solimicrobium silvestre]|uniref:Arabinose-binding domain of AraC transcription regulator, N-term n=1 Tax=Solimicrobium silvestre TaxID=2099400 RepID=A0A2S9GTV4_9BURK|nr:AraC family transcriptional regulator [Solimicrobium silvestre]PRC91143.1 Arabinose-binding domain of AraC transcription regulator, N-term [Solimicrobium silvestre]
MAIAKPEAQLPASETTTIGSYCLVIAKALESCGVDSARVFRAVGIPIELSTDPLSRLPTETLTKLYRACVEVTNNPYFGLIVAKLIQANNLHALGYALASSSTLMDFCQRLERYFRLVSQAARVSISTVDDKVFLRCELLTEVCGETEDAFFGFLVLTMRSLYKPTFNPIRVELCHAMPLEGAGPYEALCCSPVTFSNKVGLLVFNKADLEQQLDGSCPELAQMNDHIATQYLARIDKGDVVTRVIQKIIEFLPSGECSREKVADALCMSPATMQRKLSLRDAKFQQLLDDTRKELACSYVQQPSRSMTEITFLLGFTDSSNFTRAFKRWTGTSPTHFKSSMSVEEI